ncbi:MAG: efflux RND transporter periplasmic adaptor subunit [Alcaligenaceae bacterium]|nr:efflux RND transporter periplasmic adaptor subunit [Alcaligenaceae bacterium]
MMSKAFTSLAGRLARIAGSGNRPRHDSFPPVGSSTPSMHSSRLVRHLLLVPALVAFGALAGCQKKHEPVAQAPAAVTVAAPVQQSVQNYQTFDGTASPLLVVDLEARVPGFLEQILFKDGSQVKKGDLLFVIEQDQYKQELNLNQAIYDQAKIEFDRQSTLLSQRATSQAAVDRARSDLQQASANLQLAKINFGYTEIRAPFDGVMGRHLVDVGNYLGGATGGIKLATIRQVSPLYIYFSMNEIELLKFLRSNTEQGVETSHALVGKVPVYAALQGDTGFPHEGMLDFAASDLSASTGTLQLRAQFPNANKSIVPGVYAKVLINTSKPRDALLVPFGAIMNDQQGAYVFVVDAQNKAQRRVIETGQRFGALMEVTQGLKADDKVVINGFVTLSPGQPVKADTGTIEPARLPGKGA